MVKLLSLTSSLIEPINGFMNRRAAWTMTKFAVGELLVMVIITAISREFGWYRLETGDRLLGNQCAICAIYVQFILADKMIQLP